MFAVSSGIEVRRSRSAWISWSLPITCRAWSMPSWRGSIWASSASPSLRGRHGSSVLRPGGAAQILRFRLPAAGALLAPAGGWMPSVATLEGRCQARCDRRARSLCFL